MLWRLSGPGGMGAAPRGSPQGHATRGKGRTAFYARMNEAGPRFTRRVAWRSLRDRVTSRDALIERFNICRISKQGRHDLSPAPFAFAAALLSLLHRRRLIRRHQRVADAGVKPSRRPAASSGPDQGQRRRCADRHAQTAQQCQRPRRLRGQHRRSDRPRRQGAASTPASAYRVPRSPRRWRSSASIQSPTSSTRTGTSTMPTGNEWLHSGWSRRSSRRSTGEHLPVQPFPVSRGSRTGTTISCRPRLPARSPARYLRASAA